MGRAAPELVEDRPIGLGHDISENVETAAMRHADHDLADTELAAALDNLLERRHHRLAAIETEALGAGVFHFEEALERLGLDQLLQDRHLALGGETGLAPLHAVLNPRPLLGVGAVHVLGADMAAVGRLETVEDLAERRTFEAENAADIDRTIVVALGEAVGLGLKLGMLASLDQFERVELGGEVAAGAIIADQHAGGERVARCGKGVALAAYALRACGKQSPLRLWRPGGAARFGQHALLVVFEVGEEGAPIGIDRGGILLVTGVEFGEVGGVRALKERRAGKHLVQFMSCHRLDLPVLGHDRLCGANKASVRRGASHAIFRDATMVVQFTRRARVVPRAAGEFATTIPASRIASTLCLASPLPPEITAPA